MLKYIFVGEIFMDVQNCICSSVPFALPIFAFSYAESDWRGIVTRGSSLLPAKPPLAQ